MANWVAASAAEFAVHLRQVRQKHTVRSEMVQGTLIFYINAQALGEHGSVWVAKKNGIQHHISNP